MRDFIHVGLLALHHITHWALWTRMWIGRGQLTVTSLQPGMRAGPPCQQRHSLGSLPPPCVTWVSELESSTGSGKWRNLRKKICLKTCLTSFNFKLSHLQNETKYNYIPHEVLVWSRLDWKVTLWESVRAFGEKYSVSLRDWCLDLNGAAVAQVPQMASLGVHTIAETWTPGFVI